MDADHIRTFQQPVLQKWSGLPSQQVKDCKP
jgi:hypothetical protein